MNTKGLTPTSLRSTTLPYVSGKEGWAKSYEVLKTS
jgi:hypothetical protein